MIGELVRRYGLDEAAERRLATLLEALTDDPLAPTSVRDPARALNDHLADSLVALELREVRTASMVADLGSGAGLPGLPLAIALPTTAVHLVESNGRKSEFIAKTVELCGLT